MGRGRRQKRLPPDPVEVNVESLSHDGRGVARIEGKTVFIHGALPDERVRFRYTKQRKSHDEGEVVEVLQASPDRVEPQCPHFGLCGGCSLQHLSAEGQVAAKQQALLDALSHIGKVRPDEALPPLVNESPWGYRRKARLGAKYVPKKGRVLVGFRERGTSFLAELNECHVLHPRVGFLLLPLSALIGALSIRDRVPQVEVSMDDERLVLIFRIMEPLTAEDEIRLRGFAEQHQLSVYLQPGGPETIAPLDAPMAMHYTLPDFGLELAFLPTDFTQVNTAINRQMTRQAVDMLQLDAGDRVLDLFCGVGNFTLPLATQAGEVVGVEGDTGLVSRARENASRNGLGNASFHVANLYEDLAQAPWLKQAFHKALIDPPRSGALEVLGQLPKLGIDRLVYVSCYPGTLARDAGELVHKHGYKLLQAGVMDMFPHTAHVESIALFEKT